MCREIFDQRPGIAERLAVLRIGKERNISFRQQRRFRRQLSGPLVCGRKFARLVFAGLDVGLIERIDTEDRTRNGRRKFPAEEFLADVIAIGDGDAHDRMTRAFQRGDCIILFGIRFARQAHIDEQAIRPVDIGRPKRLGIDRNEALAVLAG